EPDVEDVALLAELAAAALRARLARREKLAGRMLVPGVGPFLAEEVRHPLEELRGGDRLAALLAIENGDRHAPQPLARDAPVGAVLHHAADAFLAPGGVPLHFLDLFECVRAQCSVIGGVHRDEPLLGGAEDDRVLAAPAVRI